MKSKIWKLRLKRLGLTKRYSRTLSKLAGTDFQARLLKQKLQGQKRYEATDIERLGKELDNLDIEQEEIQRLLQEKVDNLEKVDTDLLSQQVEEAKIRKQTSNKV